MACRINRFPTQYPLRLLAGVRQDAFSAMGFGHPSTSPIDDCVSRLERLRMAVIYISGSNRRLLPGTICRGKCAIC